VQGRGGARVGKGKKGGKEREGARGRKKNRRQRRKKGRGKKGSGKGILAIPILVCFRRRCSHTCLSDVLKAMFWALSDRETYMR